MLRDNFSLFDYLADKISPCLTNFIGLLELLI